MNFLNPSLLAVLAPLLALPLLIHLFNRRFPFVIHFPNIERIRRSMAERSKLARWRHLLMWLLRTIIVALFLLAFLKPVWPSFGARPASANTQQNKARRILLILDHSLSMEHLGAGSAARNALAEAGKLLASLNAQDEANAIIADAEPSILLLAFTQQHEELRRAMSTLPPSAERADLSKALALAASLFGGEGAPTEIFFLSDFQRANWADVSFDTLPKDTRLFFIDTTGSSPGQTRPNTALLSAVTSTSSVSARDTVKLDLTLGNYTDAPVSVPVEAIIDAGTSVNGEIKAAAWSTGLASLTFTAPGEGLHSIEVRTPEDALPQDNRRFLKLAVRQREEVLLLCDADHDAKGAKFLSAALNPYEDLSSPFAPRLQPSAAVTPAQMAAATKIVLTGIGQFPGDLGSRLMAFLEKGGGLVYFLDGEKDRENLSALDKLAGKAVMPFQLAGRMSAENFKTGSQKIAKGNFDSRFLRLFQGANRQALARLEFYEIQRALPTGQGEVLLSFADGTPALGLAQVGLGSVLLCNFAPAELASNLARQRVFPAWIQEMVKNLAPEETAPETHYCGHTVSGEVWRRDLENNSVLDTDARPMLVDVANDGERAFVSFKPKRPGFYALKNGPRLAWGAAVNLGENEADLRAIDTEEITRRAGADRQAAGFFLQGADDYSEVSKGRPLHHWFILAAAFFLLVEMLLGRLFTRYAIKPAPLNP